MSTDSSGTYPDPHGGTRPPDASGVPPEDDPATWRQPPPSPSVDPGWTVAPEQVDESAWVPAPVWAPQPAWTPEPTPDQAARPQPAPQPAPTPQSAPAQPVVAAPVPAPVAAPPPAPRAAPAPAPVPIVPVRVAPPPAASALQVPPPAAKPSRPAARRRSPVAFLLAGLLLGLLAFGPIGYLAGSTLGPNAKPDPTAGPTGGASLPPYQASQLALNRAKFTGDLAALAEPWLAWVGGCTSSDSPRGPKVEVGEEIRVLCRYGGINLYFVQYKSATDLNKVRLTRQRQNIDAQEFAPGATTATQKTDTSGKNTGDYVEFAYRTTNVGTFTGVWWTKADTLATAYMEAPWEDGLGQRWEPLRDVWQRYS